MNILIIDNNETTVVLLKAFLRQVVSTTNIFNTLDEKDVIGCIKNNDIDVVIISNDTLMPLIDVINETVNVISICITTNEATIDKNKFTFVAQKPVRKTEFKSIIAAAILKNYSKRLRKNKTN